MEHGLEGSPARPSSSLLGKRPNMEDREDLRSILEYLPVVLRSSSLFWPSQVVEALTALSRGPEHSRVDSGEVLFVTISDLRRSLFLTHSSERLASCAAEGYALFFDDFISRAESVKWFGEVVPALANLLLRLPALLEAHYICADSILINNDGRRDVKTGLRILEPQEPGIVFLSQELIGALLACSFFCLFPGANRGAKHLPTINFDYLFATLYSSYSKTQENKIRCITHYLERICSCMPCGVVSFERKVLLLGNSATCASYPDADFWSNSFIPLCHFKVYGSCLIEDQPCEALEVDFANRYLGGGALHRGCVQEEIRFMINPELIAGMLFLPSMMDNEAIEIVGVERFSHYIGYASSFRFAGDYIDKRDLDLMGRRKTRIVAIDALCSPGKGQYGLECLMREINKAFCGFTEQSKYRQYQRLFKDDELCRTEIDQDVKQPPDLCRESHLFNEAPTSLGSSEAMFRDKQIRNAGQMHGWHVDHQEQIGIATGNWGCGAFGGDPELKAIIQWLAASQALRPFISYYLFNMEALQKLDEVSRWILSHEWTVGELWNMLVDYSSQRVKGETKLSFFTWLLPSLSATSDAVSDAMVLDDPETP
ncbi:Poly(ADP-ribose) glycohydrolase [Bertholletia excelsa]